MPAPAIAAAATRVIPQAAKAAGGAPKPPPAPPGGAAKPPAGGKETPSDFGHGKPETSTLDKINTGANVIQTGAMVKDMLPQGTPKPEGDGKPTPTPVT